MSTSTILIMANREYVPHAKALMVNCRRQGGWQGDFCLLTLTGVDASSIEGRGIHIEVAPETEWKNLVKFRTYSPWLKRWKLVLYLDCDTIVQGDLNAMVEQLSPRFPSIMMDGSTAYPGSWGVTILQNWEHFDQLASGTTHPDIYERIRENFPHLDQPCFGANFVCFDPRTIPENTVDQLFAINDAYKEANGDGCDQMVANMLLYDRLEAAGKDHVIWFAFDEPGNRVACPIRKWRGDEEPEVLHYWDMYAPWRVKQEKAGGHWNHRLGRVCHELYAENRDAFEEVFPHV